MPSLREQVTFEQYNDPSLTWGREGGKDSPYRQFLARHILPFVGEVDSQSAADIGCGTGWLLHLLGQNGARRLVGVEPSNYAKLARHSYPEAQIVQSSIEDFETDEKFDLVTFVMSSEGVYDLESAFKKCKQMLNSSGRIVLCKGNYEYFCSDKYDYILTREELIPGEETIVKTERPSGYGTTIDIYRTADRVISLANYAGLKQAGNTQPIKPDAQVIKDVPRYSAFKQQPIMELLEFRI